MTKALTVSRMHELGIKHLRQPYLQSPTAWWAEDRYIGPDRRVTTSYECLACHNLHVGRIRFNQTYRERDTAIREWKAKHKTHPTKLIDLFGVDHGN
jgi:hypothetical protein